MCDQVVIILKINNEVRNIFKDTTPEGAKGKLNSYIDNNFKPVRA